MRVKPATLKRSRAPLITKPRGEEETTRLIHIDKPDLRLVEEAARRANKSTGYYITSTVVAQARRDLAS